MTKQEAIQKGWAKIWDIIEEQVKENILKDDGWSYEITESWLIAKGFELDFKGKYCRPKSLQGLETNNGWIKIDENFEWGKYNDYLIFFNSVTNESVISSKFSLCEHQRSDYKERFTHYQPIQKPQPPIH